MRFPAGGCAVARVFGGESFLRAKPRYRDSCGSRSPLRVGQTLLTCERENNLCVNYYLK